MSVVEVEYSKGLGVAPKCMVEGKGPDQLQLWIKMDCACWLMMWALVWLLLCSTDWMEQRALGKKIAFGFPEAEKV